MLTFGLRYSADAAGGGAPVDVSPAESAPAAEAPAQPAAESPAAAPASEPAPAWNGELEHLAKQEWFAPLDEATRKAIESGVREKVKNLESGYGKKFNELAEQRKAAAAWEAEKARLVAEWNAEKEGMTAALAKEKEDAELFRDLFGGDDKEFRAKLDAAKAEAVKPYEEKVKALESLTAEVESLRAFKTDAEAREKARYDAMVDAEAKVLQEKVADILPHKEAMDKLERLIGAGEEVDDAIAYVKRKFGIKAPVMPESALNASRGDGPAGAETVPQGLSMDQRIQWAVDRAARKLGAGS